MRRVAGLPQAVQADLGQGGVQVRRGDPLDRLAVELGIRAVRAELARAAELQRQVAGGAAALGGVIDASRVLSAQASNGGTALTFTVLAGIVVSGTSILGGEGAIWRSVVGVLFIALIGNSSDLLGLNPLYDQIALGGILLIAVGGDAWSRVRTG